MFHVPHTVLKQAKKGKQNKQSGPRKQEHSMHMNRRRALQFLLALPVLGRFKPESGTSPVVSGREVSGKNVTGQLIEVTHLRQPGFPVCKVYIQGAGKHTIR